VRECCESEGILPAIESAHALAGALRVPYRRFLAGIDDHPGTELVNDEVIVNDGRFSFEPHGTCGFTRDFEYAG